MRNKQTIRLSESKLRGIIREAVKNALTEDNFTEVLSNPFNDPDEPEDNRISAKQLKVLDNIADTIADIANNTSENADLLFDAINSIEKFVEAHTNVEPVRR